MNYLSSSSKATWLACRLRSFYAKRDDLTLPPEVASPLIRGTAGHAALEYFYSVAPNERSLEALLINAQLSVSEQARSFTELGYELADWHIDEYKVGLVGAQKALTTFWKTVGQDVDVPRLCAEANFSVPLSNGWEYHGIVDGVQETADSVIIFEHKFPTSNPSDLDQYVHFSPQVREYAWGLSNGRQVWVQFNICGPGRMARSRVPVPRGLIAEARRNLRQVANDMQKGVIVPTEGFHCLRCPFKQMCLARTSGGEIDYYKENEHGDT